MSGPSPAANPLKPAGPAAKQSDGFRRVAPAKRNPAEAAAPPRAEVTLSRKEAQALASAVQAQLPQKIALGPVQALELLEHNMLNRPVSDVHVQRIARQITQGKWKYNGDSIKIASTGDILDGQHRLWAIAEAKQAVDTVIVWGIARDAFATIDTVRRPRSGGDTIALTGMRPYRNQIAAALAWLLRCERHIIESYRMPIHRIENAEIEAAFAQHPGIERAVGMAMKARLVANPGLTGFAYYAMANKNPEIAEAFMQILIDPAGVAVNHPFFRLRAYFLTDKQKQKDPITSLALIFKAATLVAEGKPAQVLVWRSQGAHPEPFPNLDI